MGTHSNVLRIWHEHTNNRCTQIGIAIVCLLASYTVWGRLTWTSGCVFGHMLALASRIRCAVVYEQASLYPRHLRMPLEQPCRVVERTLFIVTHSATDEEYTDNLNFFIKHGMGGQDRHLRDYIIVVQQLTEDRGYEDRLWLSLPTLPDNARYLQHNNVCFDWGTFGWALSNLDLDINAYNYFFFMNTSIRGPYLPSYVDAQRHHWSQLFTSRLTNKVKLVGSTISCEAAHEFGGFSGRGRHNPHVQSYIMATDQVGLKVLFQDGHVFECHKDISAAVYNAELGSSLAIFRAGYTIDSLMLRYQGIDWTNPANWQCNDNLNPYADFAYDGLLLNPLEVVFVKVKRFQQEASWGSARLAAAYSRWMDQEKFPGSVSSNEMTRNKLALRLGRVLEMMLRGPACFDFEAYLKANPDLVVLPSQEHIWLRFVLEDQFTGRKFRFSCDNPLREDGLAADIVGWQYNLIRRHTDPRLLRK